MNKIYYYYYVHNTLSTLIYISLYIISYIIVSYIIYAFAITAPISLQAAFFPPTYHLTSFLFSPSPLSPNILFTAVSLNNQVILLLLSGGVPPILKFLRSEDNEMRASACGALQSICYHKEGRDFLQGKKKI
jgi:hypothetical protein